LRWRRLAAEYGTHSGIWLFHSVRDGKKHLTTRAAELEIKDTAVAAGLSRADISAAPYLPFSLCILRAACQIEAVPVLLPAISITPFRL